jgi:hypothetical protein
LGKGLGPGNSAIVVVAVEKAMAEAGAEGSTSA